MRNGVWILWAGALSVLCLLPGLFVGCGTDNPLGRKAISGEVKLDGAPIDNGSIEFHPLATGGTQSGGMISSGSYSIPDDQGLTAGKYRVMVFAQTPSPPLPEGFMPGDDLPFPPPKELVPPEWNSQSKQTIEVKAEGPFEFNFDISTKKK